MSDSACHIELASSNNEFFSGSVVDDVMIHPQYATQKIMIGTSNGPLSAITVAGSNVGIQDAMPSYPLDVTGDINFTGILRQNGTPYIGSQWSNNSSNVFLLSSNVGIGTSTPSYMLDVQSANAVICVRNSTNTGGRLLLGNSSHGIARGANISGASDGNDVTVHTAGGGSVTLATGGGEGLRVNSSANVGIGTTTPSYKLDVVGGIRATGVITSSYTATFSTTQYGVRDFASFATGSSGSMQFTISLSTSAASTTNSELFMFVVYYNMTSNTWRRCIPYSFGSNDSDGYELQVRVTNGTTTFRVVHSTNSIASQVTLNITCYYPQNSVPTATALTGNAEYTDASYATYSILSTSVMGMSNGNVGIGTFTPSTTLDVNGTINATAYTGTTITSLSNLGVFGSNTSVSASNTAVSASNTATWASNNLFQKSGGTITGNVNLQNNIYRDIPNYDASWGDFSQFTISTASNVESTSWTSQLKLGVTNCNAGIGYIQTINPWIGVPPLVLQPSGGQVGVGKSNPTEFFDVKGNIKASSNIYVMSRLGVGTSNPSVPVHVVGDMRVEGNLNVNGIYNTINTDVQVTDQFTVSNNGTGPALNVYQFGAQSIADFYDDSNLALRIADGGNVGINYTSPSKKLDVVGTARVSSETTYLSYDASRGFNVIGTNGIMRLWRPTGDVTYELITGSKGVSPGSTGNFWWDFFASYTNGSFNIRDRSVTGGNTTTRLAIDSNGNVGIGTTTPSYKLDVSGNTRLNNALVGDIGFGAAYAGFAHSNNFNTTSYALLQQNTGPTFINCINGSLINFRTNNTEMGGWTSTGLGIGTTSPSYKLDVTSTIKSGQKVPFFGTTSGGYRNIILTPNSGETACEISFEPNAEASGSNTVRNYIYNDSTGITMGTATGGNTLFVGSNANLGIGTSVPAYKLEVSGTTRTQLLYAYNANANTPATGTLGGSGDKVVLWPGGAGVHPYSLGVANNTLWYSTPGTAQHHWYIGGSVGMTLSNYNLGIGAASPAYKLDVSGKQRLTSNVVSQNAGPRLQIADFDGTEDSSMYGIVQVTQNSAGTSTYSNQACMAFVRSGNWTTGLGFAKGSNVFGIGHGKASTTDFSPNWLAVTQGGNVGVGTTGPAYKLDVAGDINFTGALRSNGNIVTFGGGGGSQWTSSGASIYVGSGSNVGLNTTSPSYLLDVAGYSRIGQTYTFTDNFPFGNTSTNRRYALLALVFGNNGFARIQGIAGGHDSASGGQGKCRFDITIDGRNAILRGNVANLLGNNQAGIVIYKDNTSSAYTVYLTGQNWFRHNTVVYAADSTGTTVSTSLSWGTDTAWTTPTGTTLWLDTSVHIPQSGSGTDFYMSSAATPVYGITQLNSGYVGIGNSNPGYPLDVAGVVKSTVTGGANTTFILGNSMKCDVSEAVFYWRNSNLGIDVSDPTNNQATNKRHIILNEYAGTSSGFVGIGTASPTHKLDVIGEVNLRTMPLSGGGVIRISRQSDTNRYSEIYCQNSSTAADNKMVFRVHDTTGNTTTTDVMTLTGSGNVGIGTTTPQYKVQATGTISIYQSGEARYHLYNGGGTAEWRFGQKTNTSHNFILSKLVSGSEFDYLTVDTSGNVGVGTTAPSNKLDVSGMARIKSTVAVKGSGTTQTNMLSIETSDASPLALNFNIIPSTTTTAQGIHIHSVEPGVSDDRNLILQGDAGRVGIGTKSPSYTLHVSGNIYASGDITGFSDIRLKSNMTIIDSALAKLHTLGGYTFNVKDDERVHTGLIAQEVQKVLPEAVYEEVKQDGTKGYLSIAYGNMAGLLVEAIKEVDNKYKDKVNTLEEQVASLTTELAEMKQLLQQSLGFAQV